MVRNISRILTVVVFIFLAACAGISRPTVTQLTPQPPVFMVAFPLTFVTTDGKHRIVVPAGFVTDLASIPRSLWWWQAPHQRTMAPAILHDFLYWDQTCSKDEADAVMYVAMREAGISRRQARLVYGGIRTPFADIAWNKNRAARERGEPRFFSPSYATVLMSEELDSAATLQSIQAAALEQNGVVTPEFPAEELKAACAETLREFSADR